MDSFDVFALFGPGAIYSRNTLQNFIDFFMRIDFNNYMTEIPFIIQNVKRQQNSDIAQLADLDGSRAFLLKKFARFLAPFTPLQLEIMNPEPPLSNLSVRIADVFIFPTLELLTNMDFTCAEQAVYALSQFFQNSQWDGDSDIPVISDRIVNLMSNIFEREDITEPVSKELISFWLDFISSRGRIEDMMALTYSWIKQKNSPMIPVTKIQESIISLVSYPQIVSYIDTARSIPFYVGKFIDPKATEPATVNDIVQRRAAALYGFLFVADPRFGLVKVGTGQNNTVFTSLELEEDQWIRCVPQSLAIANDLLFFRHNNCPCIEILSILSLKHIAYVLEDGTISQEIHTSEQIIPPGPFTGFKDKLYFVHDSVLSIFYVTKEKLQLVSTISLHAEKTQLFDAPIPISSNNICTLITNSQHIFIMYPLKYGGKNMISIREFDIPTGDLINDTSIQKLLSNCIAFDPTTITIYDLPDYEVSFLYKCSPNVLSPIEFKAELKNTNIPPLDIISALPPLLASRLSNQTVSLRQKFVMFDPKPAYKALEIAIDSEYAEQFVPAIVKIIYLHLRQFKNSVLPSLELIISLIKSKYIPRFDLINLIHSLFAISTSPLDKMESFYILLEEIEPSLLIDSLQNFESLAYAPLAAILSFTTNKFVKYAINHFNHTSYSFLQLLVSSITRYVIRDGIMHSSFVLPIFKELLPIHSHLFLSLMATMLPLLQNIFSSPLAFASSISIFESFLKDMHQMIPQNALKDYATYHISVSSEQPFIVKTVIDETPHPYLNNTDYVHHYEFPSSIEITITFDPQTNSESNCDWLQIFTDRDCTKLLTERMSGRHPRWKDKIVTTAKHLSFKFHSDGSVNEWGYKATISAKIFSRNNFTSPHPAYDVFRTFFDILLKMMKVCDATTQFLPKTDFRFDEFDPTDFDFNKIELTKVQNKFGFTLDIPETQLSSVQIAMINHFLKFEDNHNVSDFVKDTISAPFSVLMFKKQGLSDHFSNLANLMLFYIPQGTPDSELDFLYKSLKGTRAAEQFVSDSLSFAEAAFKSPNITLSSICYAANKASLAFQLLQEPNYGNYLNQWFDCLRALSKITSTPNSTLTPTSLDSILDFGCMFGDAFESCDDFVKRHLDILKETKINSPSTDTPVVFLIVHRLLLIKNKKVSNDLMVDLILRILQFKLPHVISSLNKLIDEFNVTLTEITPLLKEILKEIGEFYTFDPKLDSETIVFDAGVSFSCAKAECIRKMTHHSLFVKYAEFLKQDDVTALAILLILSCRSFQIRPQKQVHITGLNTKARITAIDPLRFTLLTERGDSYVLPSFDYSSVSSIPFYFTQIIPDLITQSDERLVDPIINLLKGKFRGFAYDALAEVLPNATVNFVELFKRLKSVTFDEPKEEFPNKLVNYENMTKMLQQCKKTENSIAYVYNDTISMYRFIMEPGHSNFGFCDARNCAPSCAVLFDCNDKSVSFNDKMIAENETIQSIVVGYLTDGMRIFLIVNKQLKLTDFYLPPMQRPIPLIITTEKEIKFEASPVIDLPLFNPRMSIGGHQPTHIFIADKVIPIDTICTPYIIKFGELISFDLLPSISSKIPYYYIEFALMPEAATISLRSPSHRAFSFYLYQAPAIKASDTLGLFINFESEYVFVTKNGEIINDSISTLHKSDWILSFKVNSLESIFINLGQLPYMFDCDEFLNHNHEFIPPKESNSERSMITMKTPLPPVFVPSKVLKFNSFSNSQPTSHQSSVFKPYLINTSEKGSFFNGKIGYGRYTSTPNISLTVVNDDSFTISQVNFPSNNVVSLLDEISSDLPSFQCNYQRVIHQIPIELQHPLISKEGTFFLPDRCSEYLLNHLKSQHFFIMNMCMDRILDSVSVDDAIRDYNLDNFIIQSITAVNSVQYQSYNQILEKIFLSNHPLFDELCKKALIPFTVKQEDFSSEKLYMICNSNSDALSRITLEGADAILVVPVESTFLQGSHDFHDNFGNHIIISKETQAPIFTMQGDTIVFDAFKPDELILVHIIPINFKIPNGKIDFLFTVRFITSLIDFTIKHPEIWPQTHHKILLPLWKIFMRTNTRVFNSYQAKWMTIIFSDFVSDSELEDYRKELNFPVIINDQPNILTGIICVLSLFIHCNQKDPHATQSNLLRIIEFALDVEEKKRTYATQVYKQFAVEMLNPFRKTMPFLSSKIEYHPLVSTLAFKAMYISTPSPHSKLITQNNHNDLPSVFVFDFTGVEKVAIVHVHPLVNITVSVNQSQVSPDCLVDGGQLTIKITRSSPESKVFALLLMPISTAAQPHVKDIQRLHYYQSVLAEKWTSQHESIARCFTQIALYSNSFYIFAAYPDALYESIFPGIPAEVVRYRCTLLYLIQTELSSSCTPHFDSELSNSLVNKLVPILIPATPWKERVLMPIEAHLITKNAKLSDFFFQLCQTIDNAPYSMLLDLGDTIQHPGTAEIVQIDLIFRQLTDDLFVPSNYSMIPSKDATSPSHLRAYQAFGCHMAALILSGKPLPLPVSRVVIRFALGGTLIEEDFEDTDIKDIKSIRIQLEAIRAGAYKIELASPMIKPLANDPIFPRTCQLLPLYPIEVTGSHALLSSLYLNHPLILPYLRMVMMKKQRTVGPAKTEFVNRFVFDFDETTNTIIAPELDLWIESFSKHINKVNS